jgi:hypothetical protein
MSTLLLTVITDILKALLPQLLSFCWEKAHEPTTVEEAAPDDARRDRLLAAVRLQRGPGGDGPRH